MTTREEIIEGLRPLVLYIDPCLIPDDNPVNELIEDWIAKNDDESELFNFLKTTIYFDAGFSDPIYLSNLLDWLEQDYQNAIESEQENLSKDIENKIDQIKELIN